MADLHTPAWWCENCQTWWPGSWLVSLAGDEPVDPETAKPYVERTCAECGGPLVPRPRPLRR